MLIISWVALLVSAVIAFFLGLVIWRQNEVPAGAYIVFCVFAGLPVVVLSLPQITPMMRDYCVETPDGRYCLSQVGKEVNKAQKEAELAVQALKKSVAAAPPIQVSLSSSEKAKLAPASTTECRPYTYSDGSKPSAGLLLVGSGKNNWFPVVASIYGEADAIKTAQQLQKTDSTYRLEVHKASDGKGDPVWALTLGSGLSQDDAVARTCYAQRSDHFDRGSYAWASDRWGPDVMPK